MTLEWLSAEAAVDTITVWLFVSGINLTGHVAIQTLEMTGYLTVEPSLEHKPFKEFLFGAFCRGGLIAGLFLLGRLALGVAP